ncbi:MAG: hypothetical protein ACK45V_11600, partial [Brevundimonas sp.]
MVERLLSFRARADRLAGVWCGAGFAPAKRPQVRRLLNAPTARVHIHNFARNAARQAEPARPDEAVLHAPDRGAGGGRGAAVGRGLLAGPVNHAAALGLGLT